MHNPGINGEGDLRRQPAIPGSPGKMAVKTECVCCDVVGALDKLKSSSLLYCHIHCLLLHLVCHCDTSLPTFS